METDGIMYDQYGEDGKIPCWRLGCHSFEDEPKRRKRYLYESINVLRERGAKQPTDVTTTVLSDLNRDNHNKENPRSNNQRISLSP